MNRTPTRRRRGAPRPAPKPATAVEPSPARSRVSLRQLEAFCTVAMTGTVSGAARRLARTQSAVSSAIGELESAIGETLFERAGRGLRATDAARRLLPRALEVVERAGELPAVAAGVPGDAERLRVGASRTNGPCLMPGLLGRFAAARPQATVDLVVANTADLLARLHRLELDLAFVEGDVPAPGLALDAWQPDTLCLLARAGHPLAERFGTGRRPLGGAAYAQALAQSRWVLREGGSGTRETFLRALAPVIGAPRVAVTVDDPPALLALLAEGDWIGCTSRLAAADSLAAGRLVELRPPGAETARALVRRFWIVRRPDRYRTAAVDALLAQALRARRHPAR
ncbi:MAG: LysR substrate-binding domain-containing protein [Burkholderiales bacterium]|nr:LysR substrate-binding domain-containing protein [Burkholderiales bacterium]